MEATGDGVRLHVEHDGEERFGSETALERHAQDAGLVRLGGYEVVTI